MNGDESRHVGVRQLGNRIACIFLGSILLSQPLAYLVTVIGGSYISEEMYQFLISFIRLILVNVFCYTSFKTVSKSNLFCSKSELNIINKLSLLLLLYAVQVFLTVLLTLPLYLLHIPQTSYIENDNMIIALILVTSVLICEEYEFRGAYMKYICAQQSRVFALLTSSAVFALAHGGVRIPFTFVMGITTGLLYMTTGSLFWPIALHFLVNIDIIGYLAAEFSDQLGLQVLVKLGFAVIIFLIFIWKSRTVGIAKIKVVLQFENFENNDVLNKLKLFFLAPGMVAVVFLIAVSFFLSMI